MEQIDHHLLLEYELANSMIIIIHKSICIKLSELYTVADWVYSQKYLGTHACHHNGI